MINQNTSKKFDWQYISNEHKNDKLLWCAIEEGKVEWKWSLVHLLRGKMRVTKNFEDEVNYTWILAENNVFIIWQIKTNFEAASGYFSQIHWRETWWLLGHTMA